MNVDLKASPELECQSTTVSSSKLALLAAFAAQYRVVHNLVGVLAPGLVAPLVRIARVKAAGRLRIPSRVALLDRTRLCSRGTASPGSLLVS